MNWEIVFKLANVWALMCWAALVLLPRTEFLKRAMLYGGIGLLCVAYGSLLGLILGGVLDPGVPAGSSQASFNTIDGVRAIFAADSGVTIGWMHYLAFDLFAGLWIAQDADTRGVHRLIQAPILILTLFAGPVGMLIWLPVRAAVVKKQAEAGS